MSLTVIPKSVTLDDLERRNGLYLALFYRILVVSGAHFVKVVDSAMDNLRLLYVLVVNVCIGNARRPWYKFLADS